MTVTSRRRFVQSSAALAGAALASGCATSTVKSEQINQSRKTYILVHGAWHGGWCWDEVRAQLVSAGHRVYTPSLTGLGDRAHLNKELEVGLETHIADIVNLIKYEELDDVILVGHSYGGMVISGVADRAKNAIKELIYLDALVPLDGGSLLDPYAELSDEQAAQIASGIPLVDGNSLPLPSEEFLGLSESDPKVASLMQRLTPHPVKTIVDRLRFTNGGPENLKKSFIYCTAQVADDATKRKLEKVKSSDDWGYFEINTGHNAMTTEPVKLVDLIYKISV